MADSVLTELELRALSNWNIGSLLSVSLPRDGTVNRTVLLETTTGSYALRVCRESKTQQVLQQECDIIAFVANAGFPALAPVHLPTGLPFLELNNQLFVLFPKASGFQTHRALLTTWQLEKMGECLARLTLALEHYPKRDIYRRSFQFDLEMTLKRLEELTVKIKAFPDFGLDEKAALERVEKQRSFLQAQHSIARLEHLNFQVSHGDFHDGNLFFDGSEFERAKISAIIDWDQLRVNPRYFELLRTSHFLLAELEPKKVRHFVLAFMNHYPVDTTELKETIKLYSTERAYNLWLLETIYLEGNDRARAFLRGKFADTFTAFEEVWERLEISERLGFKASQV